MKRAAPRTASGGNPHVAISPIDLAGLTSPGGFAIVGESGGDEAGYSVAWAGDVNNDGFDDILIGAPFAVNDSTGDVDAGKAYVVFGKATPFTGTVNLASIAAGIGGFAIRGEQTLDQAGTTVAAAGDINDDGFADIAIGSISSDGPGDVRSQAGAAYIVYGKAGTAAVNLTDVAAGTGGFVIHGADAGHFAGRAIAAGDINGDGIGDLLIGAPQADGAGAGYVVYGVPGGMPAAIDLLDIGNGIGGFKLPGGTSGDSSGVRVATGDVNGDNIADMLIAAPGGERAYLVLGGTALANDPLPLASAGTAFPGTILLGPGGGTGTDVAILGDVNGDGIQDYAITAPTGASGAGQAWVVFGTRGALPATISLAGLDASQGFLIQGQGITDHTGMAIAGAGDINGDGFDDVLIGAPDSDSLGNLRFAGGEAYVLLGRSSFGTQVNVNELMGGDGGFTIYGADIADHAAASIAGGGDLDGDGFADLVIGAPGGDGTKNGTPGSGDTYVVYGRDFASTVTKLGDTAGNLLEGGAGDDSMVGGQGPDVLLGEGGADALYGGNGDDTFVIADSGFRRVDGGHGSDTLVLGGPGMLLDLTQAAGARLRGIETIDMLGGGNHVVKVSERAVDALSDTSNTITIEADSGDVIDFGSEEWVLAAPEDDPYVFYSRNNVTLRVTAGATVACFAAGTRIATTRGEIAVEHLAPGDMARLADGGTAPVRWIGHRATATARHPRPWDVMPVRVAAHAFGPGLPATDLHLSPDHAVFVHGHLVPVRYLLNGATIAQERVDAVTYFHVELAAPDGGARHGVILAQGLPVESFLDTGNRGAFANGAAAVQMQPDFARQVWAAEACAPLLTQGPALAEVRTSLLAHAEVLGHAPTTAPDAHLLVDGARVDPDWFDPDSGPGSTLGFVLPPGAREVRLASRLAAPAWLDPASDDHRRLGVAVAALAIDGIALALDDPRLAAGWHAPEPGWRWTAGPAALPAADACLVELRLMPYGRFWRARPAARERAA